MKRPLFDVGIAVLPLFEKVAELAASLIGGTGAGTG